MIPNAQIRPDEVTLFVVDDDEVDVEMIERGLAALDIVNPTVRARDGVEALEILRGEHAEKRIEGPFVMLLDLNMPRMNGIECLSEIRRDEALSRSVVFVLTTSNAESDKMAAYERNVAGYVLKARAGLKFERVLTMLQQYCRNVDLPLIEGLKGGSDAVH